MRFPPPVFHRRRRRWRRYGEWKASCKWIGPETRVAVRYTHTRTDSCGTDMKRPKHATKFMRSFNESQTEDWRACVCGGGGRSADTAQQHFQRHIHWPIAARLPHDSDSTSKWGPALCGTRNGFPLQAAPSACSGVLLISRRDSHSHRRP